MNFSRPPLNVQINSALIQLSWALNELNLFGGFKLFTNGSNSFTDDKSRIQRKFQLFCDFVRCVNRPVGERGSLRLIYERTEGCNSFFISGSPL